MSFNQKKRPNILFSTTRQWNPGDEFILHGIQNILRELLEGYNAIIFNRSPEMKHKEEPTISFQLKLRSLSCKRLQLTRYDNSFKEAVLYENFIDIVILAGTPEWASHRMNVLYEYILTHSIPALYIGIGAGSSDIDFDSLRGGCKKVISNAPLITVRDRILEKALKRFNAHYLPCPALLSAPSTMEKHVHTVKKIGLIYMANTGVRSNTLLNSDYQFLKKYYQTLLERYGERYEFHFICHYIDELPYFQKDFSGGTCTYSYDSKDYPDIYQKFDMVVGPRVHGIAMAASLGIPGISIQHDVRAHTCEGFLAEKINIADGVESAVQKFVDRAAHSDPATMSTELLNRKDEVYRKYLKLLWPFFKSKISRCS
ncbi:MAG: polysaccharide pyruvyl transferase family protein [Candidatus Omnitrophota bacterium]